EKLLLFGGAIQKAGAVKSSKIKDHARSDWIEIWLKEFACLLLMPNPRRAIRRPLPPLPGSVHREEKLLEEPQCQAVAGQLPAEGREFHHHP
ncbi:MAG: hypothetical protein EOP87_16420, partial [Verrucomicrobiaceae bacterium]